MDDILWRLSPAVAYDICSLAAAHGLEVEDVVVDLINGNYDVTEHVFTVSFPERVTAL